MVKREFQKYGTMKHNLAREMKTHRGYFYSKMQFNKQSWKSW
jgi:hypothetical protein